MPATGWCLYVCVCVCALMCMCVCALMCMCVCCPYTHWSPVKLPVASPLKIIELPSPTPHMWTRSYQLWIVNTSASLSQFVITLFNSFLSVQFLFGVVVEVVTEAFNVFHSHVWACNHQYPCKRNILAHRIRQQHESWTSTWFPVEAQNTNIRLISVDCTDHGHHYGLWGDQGNMDHEHQYDPPVTSHTKSINMACEGSTQRRQHRPGLQHRSSLPSVSPGPWLAYSRYSIQIHWIKKQMMAQRSFIDIVYA